MADISYEKRLAEIFSELKEAHRSHDELLAFDLVTEINRLKSLMTATAQS